MTLREAAQGAGAVVAQVVPASLRAVGDLQAARRGRGIDGHHVVVGAGGERHRNRGGVGDFEQLGGGAEVQRDAVTGGFGKEQFAARVIDTAHRVVVEVERAATVGDFATGSGQAQAAGQYRIAGMDGGTGIERAVEHRCHLAARRVKQHLPLPGGGEIDHRRFDLAGGHELFHDGGHL